MEKTEVARIDNPYAVAGHAQGGGQVVVESQRAVAEVLAAMQVARQFPRDRRRAVDMILTDCTLPQLAEDAVYEYARGGSDISGPTIRLAEVLAQRWGNLACGVKELARRDDYSEVMAYAIDLETGFRDEKTFQVKHWRDTKKGGYKVTDERDIYEVVANQGARRKRACILAVIPKDVQEAAVKQCEVTLQSKVEITPETINKLVGHFQEKYGVTQQMIEKRIQRRIDAITPGMVVQLRKISNSLRDNMSVVTDWFEVDGSTVGKDAGAPQTGSTADKLAGELAGKRREPATPPKTPPPAEPETGEITNASLRKAITDATTQEALTPILMDIMRLPAGPDRDETSKVWTQRVEALKGGKPKPAENPIAAKPAEKPAPKEKPKGTAKIKSDLLFKMNNAKTKEALDEAAGEITLYVWGSEDANELSSRYAQCSQDLDL